MRDVLHWLPPARRFELRILRFVALSLNRSASVYLSSLCNCVIIQLPRARLRSSSQHALIVPRSNSALCQKRSFASIGPVLWNRLDFSIRHLVFTGTLSVYLARVKTYLFNLSC